MTIVNDYDEWITDVINTTETVLVAANVSVAANGTLPPGCMSTLQKKEPPFVKNADIKLKMNL